MCAIAGAINQTEFLKNNPQVIDGIKNCLSHRGPDSSGVYINGDAVLIHNRLAIIDPKNGSQPMICSCQKGEYAIVYNGELYNTDEVKAELSALGYDFKTKTDTEVVLKAFIEWGEDCLSRFNGIFGFAVWNCTKKRLFLARDKMGVKPLFYAVFGDKLIFASELKGILKNPLARARINTEGAAEIMLIGPGRTPGCGIFENVRELKPGECGVFEDGRLKTHLYFELYEEENTESFEECAEHTAFLVKDAIKRQLVSDVGLGAFLSGGLDSSIICSVAADELSARGEKLHTYSVSYLDNDKYFVKNKFQPNSDDDFIGIMTDFLDSSHQTTVVDTAELVAANYRAVEARDLPGMADVDGSLYLFCKDVRQREAMALSGECADELFGGYPWYRDKAIRERDGFPWSQITDFRASLLSDDIRKRIDPAAFVHEKYKETIGRVSGSFNKNSTERRMREMYLLNVYWFMQNLLERKDRMSMASGLEVRVPFCDERLVRYMYNVPWEYKDYEGREKGLLRKALEDILPGEIAWRKKSPYPKTHNPGYKRAIDGEFMKLCENLHAPVFELLKRSELLKLRDTDEVIYWYGQLMATPQTKAFILGLNYWLEKYNVDIVK